MAIAATNDRRASGTYTIEIQLGGHTVVKELPPAAYRDIGHATDEATKLCRTMVRKFMEPLLVSVWSVRINGCFSGDNHFWMLRNGTTKPASFEDVALPDQK